MAVTERNNNLKRAFGYSDGDLLLNQQEKVGEGQQTAVKTYRRGRMISLIGFAVMFVVFALVCVGGGISLLVSPQQGGSMIRPAIVFASGAAVLLYAASALNFFIRSRDIVTGKVSHKQGAAKLYTRQYRGEYSYLGMGWFVKIDGKEFRLMNAEQYAALEESANYHIYYVKDYPLDLLLAVETV